MPTPRVLLLFLVVRLHQVVDAHHQAAGDVALVVVVDARAEVGDGVAELVVVEARHAVDEIRRLPLGVDEVVDLEGVVLVLRVRLLLLRTEAQVEDDGLLPSRAARSGAAKAWGKWRASTSCDATVATKAPAKQRKSPGFGWSSSTSFGPSSSRAS